MMNYVTREELRGLSPKGLVVLYVNRANDLFIEEKQIKIDKAVRKEDGIVEVTVSPDQTTGWVNGPIVVQIPAIQVGEIYAEETSVAFADITEDKVLMDILTAADLPPCPPSSVEVAYYDILADGPDMVIGYRLKYTNAFFVGETVVAITGAPNNLDTLRLLNQFFIGN